ncbi:erythroid differentiation-related factor 1, partial [Lates japonicus]
MDRFVLLLRNRQCCWIDGRVSSRRISWRRRAWDMDNAKERVVALPAQLCLKLQEKTDLKPPSHNWLRETPAGQRWHHYIRSSSKSKPFSRTSRSFEIPHSKSHASMVIVHRVEARTLLFDELSDIQELLHEVFSINGDGAAEPSQTTLMRGGGEWAEEQFHGLTPSPAHNLMQRNQMFKEGLRNDFVKHHVDVEDIHMLVGSNMPIFGGGRYPAVSLRP